MYLLIGIPVLAYFGLPLVIKSTLRINARPALNPLTPAHAPDDVQEYFASVGPKLSGLGFEQAACFSMENSTPNTTPYVSLWINRKTGQAATANVIIAKNGDRPPVVKSHVEFCTKLADGPAVNTTNSADLGAFKKTKSSDTISATRLQDPGNLYRLHTWRESKLASQSAERFLPAAGTEAQWFADLYEESIVRQVATGYLQCDPNDPSVYTPTLAGAYAMTWAQLPPMKQMNRSAEDRRAESQIRQASSASLTPAANVKVTSQLPQRKAA
jgi:hypothetical protein